MKVDKTNMNQLNPAISITRVVGMFLIIFCHLIQYYDGGRFSNLSQVLNVGVMVFLLISGYLYSQKPINDNKTWIIRRMKKILIPLYIFMIFIFVYRYLILGLNLEVNQYLIYLFDLQGINFLIKYFNGGNVQGATHLWFLTVILICYFITIKLNKIDKKIFKSKRINIIIVLLIFLQILLCYFAIYINYISIYIFGYILGNIWFGKIGWKKYIMLTILNLIGLVIRLYSRSIIDGTILYDNIIVLITQDIFAIWIFISISKFCSIKYRFVCNMVSKKMWIKMDKLSFYIYITHYMYLVGPFNIRTLNISVLSKGIIFLMLTVASASILCYISEWVNRSIEIKHIRRKK